MFANMLFDPASDNTYYVKFPVRQKEGPNRWEVLFGPEGRNLMTYRNPKLSMAASVPPSTVTASTGMTTARMSATRTAA